MAKQKKMIPCRVCGKMFEPCSYCQKHNDVFRWRNFACSVECAQKYIASTEAYREAQKEKAKIAESKGTDNASPKKRGRKKAETVVEETVEDTKVTDDAETVEVEVDTVEVVEDTPTIDNVDTDDIEPVEENAEETDGIVDNEIATDTEIQEE